MLELSIGGRTGPNTVAGFTTATSTPFSAATSQAAFSAHNFESGYHNYKNNTLILRVRQILGQKPKKYHATLMTYFPLLPPRPHDNILH